MSNVWEYFSAEQQEKLTKKMEEFTPEQLKGFRKEANELIAKLRAAMEKSTPPESPEVVRLAKRMKLLLMRILKSTKPSNVFMLKTQMRKFMGLT